MRSSRPVLPFALGAVSMLGVVLATAWAAPRLMDRALVALAPGEMPIEVASDPAPAGVREASTPEIAAALTDPSGGAPTAAAPTGISPAVPEPAAASVAAGTPSRLLIPVQGVEGRTLVDTYEEARGQGRRHDAIDIMAPRGTPVLASSDGVVMKLFESELGGTTLYQLAPDRRTIYYYAHLAGYAPGMTEGRALRRGEVLGYVGDTGDAVPGNYHLHFEVSTTRDPEQYWGGVPQNPYPLLR